MTSKTFSVRTRLMAGATVALAVAATTFTAIASASAAPPPTEQRAALGPYQVGARWDAPTTRYAPWNRHHVTWAHFAWLWGPRHSSGPHSSWSPTAVPTGAGAPQGAGAIDPSSSPSPTTSTSPSSTASGDPATAAPSSTPTASASSGTGRRNRPSPTSSPSATSKPAPTTSTSPAAPASPSAPASNGAWPGASNTGVPAGVALRKVPGQVTSGTGWSWDARGWVTVSGAGALLSGLDISGEVDIKASNVVIENSVIHGSGTSTGVNVYSGTVTVRDSEIYGFENGIGYGGWAAYRVDIHGVTGDGVKLGTNTTLQDSWIHDMTPASGAHADGAQLQDGITNLVVRHNFFDLDPVVNSAIFIQPIFGPSTAGPILIEQNYINGGGYSIFVLAGKDAGGYTISNVTIRDNVFGRDCQYYPALLEGAVTWTNNTWVDTGKQIEPAR